MIGFRSARSPRDGRDATAYGLGIGDGDGRTSRNGRERSFGRRLAEIVGEVGAAMATPRGGSSGERR
jgi:hypothetical protein